MKFLYLKASYFSIYRYLVFIMLLVQVLVLPSSSVQSSMILMKSSNIDIYGVVLAHMYMCLHLVYYIEVVMVENFWRYSSFYENLKEP